ncbi:MAG: hypothetical protein ACJA01_001275 [Saprospiraceae bacterium]|jgi:hypothetical protein
MITPEINVVGMLNNQAGFMNIRNGTVLSIKSSGTYNTFGTMGLPTSGYNGGMNIAQGGMVNLEGTGNLVGGRITVDGTLNLGNNSTNNRNTKSNNAASLVCILNAILTISKSGNMMSSQSTIIEFKDRCSLIILSTVVLSGALSFYGESFLYIDNCGDLILKLATFAIGRGATAVIYRE